MSIKNLKVGLLGLIAVTTLGIAPTLDNAGLQVTANAESITAYAADGDASEANKGSRDELNQKISEGVNQNKYAVEGGGTLTGAQLVEKGDIVESNYNRLTSKSRQQLVTDMVQTTTDEVAKTEKKQEQGETVGPSAITAQTQQNWIQEIQAHPGVGTRMLTDILQTVKPDYNSARYIFEPFAGPLNTLIALGVIVLMTLLTLTFVIDLSYIHIPFFQGMVDGGGNGGGGEGGFSVSSIVSKEAKDAVQNDNGKSPAGAYFKKRAFGVIVLGFCILFFAQGQIFVIVGWILDIVSGILNIG